jgi:aerobic C4-dicarboxylate transport protein
MLNRLLTNGTLQLLLAITCGVLLGLLRPETALLMKPLSDGFIKLVGWLMPLMIFVLVCSGVAGIGQQRRRSQLVGKIILYFQLMSLVSLLLGFSTLFIFQMDSNVAPFDGLSEPMIGDFDAFSWGAISLSVYGVFFHNAVLGVMLLALFSGLIIGRLGAVGDTLQRRLETGVALLFGGLRMILKFAPFAAFGAMAFTVGKYGVVSILPLVKFVLVIYLACGVFVVLVLATIARLAGARLMRLVIYIKEELLLVTFTGSSVAAIPGLLIKLETAGCDRQLARLVLTTGYTFNLSGSGIYLTTALVFLAHVAGLPLSSVQWGGVLLMCMLTSLGSTSVAGSAFFTLIATLNLLHIIPLESVGLLLGVERLMKCRSLTNVLGNCVACLAICAWQQALDRVALRRELGA